MTNAARQGPTRTCVGCGSRDAQASMVRLRLDEGAGIVMVTAAPRGRSAYVHDREDCIRAIARSKVLGKSLRATIPKPMRLELLELLAARTRASRRMQPDAPHDCRTVL